MRNYLRFLVGLCALLTVAGSASAQDTTALRLAAFSDGGELILFKNDSTNLYYGPINLNASFNAMFHHPSDGQLYCLYDSVIGVGRRDIYEIDPFSGVMNFVYSPSATYLAAACVGPNGIVYAVTGHGGGTPGVIYAIDMIAGTETLFATTDFTFGGISQSGLNISYYPPTDELWLFVGEIDSLIKIDLGTQTETHVGTFLNADGGIKGTYLDGDNFWLCSDASYTYDAVQGDSVAVSTFTIPDYITDLELLDMVTGGDTIAICGGDSAFLHSRFRFDDYHWYHNGTPLATQNRGFLTATPGTYRLLTQYDNNGGFYMWSETVEVIVAPAIVADFGASTVTTVVGVPVIFSDSSIGASVYHWDFGDGSYSALANPTHTFNTAGVYNVMQVVQDGFCTDTAYLTITVAPLVGIDDQGSLTGVQLLGCFPNPAGVQTEIRLALDQLLHVDLEVLDLMGTRVARLHEGELPAGAHSIRWDLGVSGGSPLANGIYFVQMTTPLGRKTLRLVVMRQ